MESSDDGPTVCSVDGVTSSDDDTSSCCISGDFSSSIEVNISAGAVLATRDKNKHQLRI